VAERGGPKRKLSTTARIFEGRLSAAVLVVVVVVVVVAVVAVVTDIASNVGKAHTLRRLRLARERPGRRAALRRRASAAEGGAAREAVSRSNFRQLFVK